MPLFRLANLARFANLAHLVLRCALPLAAAGTLQPAAAQTNPPPPANIRDTRDTRDTSHCAVLWQVTALPTGTAGAAPQLRLGLRFSGGGRSRTALHLPGGWAALDELPTSAVGASSNGPRLQAMPGEPAWRSLVHAPGETVQLQWQLLPAGDAAQGGAVQRTAGWLAFSGQGLLPMPEGADEVVAAGAGPACVALQGLAPGSRWASSHGTAEGSSALFVLGPSAVPLAQRVQQALYAGGALQWQAAPGVLAVLPAAMPWAVAADGVAQAGARALAAQQHQWPQPAGRDLAGRDPAERGATPPWLLLVLPTPGAAVPGDALASAWHQALALQLPPAWAGDVAAVERLLTRALALAWMADRFGPLAHAGRVDAPLRAWFSAGWADFLAHRSLLRVGLWTADDYADALNARIAAYLAEPARALPNAQVAANSALAPNLAALQAMRGEWLALQWHQALRRAGHPGLDAMLRQQLVAPALARRDGPISAPLATHRVVAALRSVLHDRPLRDLQQHIDQGQPFDFSADSLGPCFQPAPAGARGAAPAWQPVAAALQQADCQGWLGLGPLADATGPAGARTDPVARAKGQKAARKAGGKAGGKAGAKAGATSRTQAGGTARAKGTAKPARKPKAGKPAR